MTASGISTSNEAISSIICNGVTPSERTISFAACIVGPSMTGSEKGIPISTALAPASAAAEIASKSPVAIYGLKAVMNYSRDHNVSDSLDFNALWSGAMLSQADMTEAMTAQMEKRDASFDKMVDVKKFNESKS